MNPELQPKKQEVSPTKTLLSMQIFDNNVQEYVACKMYTASLL